MALWGFNGMHLSGLRIRSQVASQYLEFTSCFKQATWKRVAIRPKCCYLYMT